MKVVKRTLLILMLFVIAPLIDSYFILHQIRNLALPNYYGEVTFKGLTSEVTIIRDSFANLQIYAQNESDI